MSLSIGQRGQELLCILQKIISTSSALDYPLLLYKIRLHPWIPELIWQTYLYYLIYTWKYKNFKMKAIIKGIKWHYEDVLWPKKYSIWWLENTWSYITITIVSIWWWPNDASMLHPEFTGWCLQASSGNKGLTDIYHCSYTDISGMMTNMTVSVTYPTLAQSLTMSQVLREKVERVYEHLLCDYSDDIECTELVVQLPQCTSGLGCVVTATISVDR